tara:strand:- start:4455 stop:4949 length:495 start_codon:yes stop_codon:yes gene_type:complete
MSQVDTIGKARRAIEVVPSDTINIPHPAFRRFTSTTTAGTGAATLVDSSATFETDEANGALAIGDIIYVIGAPNTIHEVVSIDSQTQLTITGTAASGAEYRVYEAGKNNGCTLIVTIASALSVETLGGDVVNFTASVPEQFPLQVVRVNDTGSTITGKCTALFF